MTITCKVSDSQLSLMSRKPNFDVNVDGQTDGRTDERTNERTDERTDRNLDSYIAPCYKQGAIKIKIKKPAARICFFKKWPEKQWYYFFWPYYFNFHLPCIHYTEFIEASTSKIQGLFKDKSSDFQGVVGSKIIQALKTTFLQHFDLFSHEIAIHVNVR